MLLALAVTLPACAPVAAAQRMEAPAVDEPCAATVIRRETLRDSTGALLYVAPDVVLSRDGELLLAGHATARFIANADSHTFTPDSQSFVGVRRTADGRTHPIAMPAALAGASLRDLRAVPLPNRRWGVLFFNQATEVQRTPKATSDSLWYGVLGPAGWERVEAIAVPNDIRLYLPVAHPMLARGEHVLAAVPAERRGGSAGVLLLEFERDAWRTRFLPTHGIAYAGLAFDGSKGALRVLAVHTDPEPVPGTRSSNELYLYDPERMQDSRIKLSVFPALPAWPAHDPTILQVGRALSVAWLAADRSEAQGRRVPTHLFVRDGVAEPPHVLGAQAARVISVPAGNEQVHVVTSHTSHVDSVQVDIHTLPALSRGVRLRHSASFAEIMGAGRWNDSTVIVTLLSRTITEATSIATEVFWIKTQCSPVPEGSRVP